MRRVTHGCYIGIGYTHGCYIGRKVYPRVYSREREVYPRVYSREGGIPRGVYREVYHPGIYPALYHPGYTPCLAHRWSPYYTPGVLGEAYRANSLGSNGRKSLGGREIINSSDKTVKKERVTLRRGISSLFVKVMKDWIDSGNSPH